MKIVKLYINDRYSGFETKQTNPDAEVHYAILVDGDYFVIGQKGLGYFVDGK